MFKLAGCQHLPDGTSRPLTEDEMPDFKQPPDWFNRAQKRRWWKLIPIAKLAYPGDDGMAWYEAAMRAR